MDSVKTALRIFEAVAERGTASLADVVRTLDEPKSTVQRGLTTLHQAGWLHPADDGARRRWRLSARLMTLMQGQDDLFALRRAARPILTQLRDETRETIHLTVRDVDRVVLVDRVDSPQILRVAWPLGSTAPLHIGSSGKAVLARLSTAEFETYLKRGLEAWTEHSIVDPECLRVEVMRVRKQGYAVSDRELDNGVRSVAASILGPTGDAIAALSISCPASRLPNGLTSRFGEMVTNAAGAISSLSGILGVRNI